jgi:NhaA family Na+:H+ antiporter
MINRIQTSIQKFIKIESFSGMLLFLATIIALVWANSPYGNIYHSIWQYKLGFSIGDFTLSKPLILWINDGLMAVFFFLIGLELKRELLIGEINSFKKASLPIIAALGGILIPIALYLVLNTDSETVKGWGIPMATDIAFALAILTLLGNRIPFALKVFLTAFAIIDDLAAVLVIALFYSKSINIILLVIALGIISFLVILTLKNKFNRSFFFFTGVIVWFLFLKSGVHPTIAGVLLAFTIPIRQKFKIDTFKNELKQITSNIVDNKNSFLLSKSQMEEIDYLENLTYKVRSPLQHQEHKLHNWVAYFILPLFAFSNAGVKINFDVNFDYNLMQNIAISLFIGKFVGISFFTYIGVKLKFVELPKSLKLNHILGIAAIAGVGFTMSIFIDNLAFSGDPVKIDSAKIGIIIGSLISGILGYFILSQNKKINE